MKSEIKRRKDHIHGRGVQINPPNPYENRIKSTEPDQIWIDHDLPITKTRIIDRYPKTIVNKVVSKDRGMEYSLNPYLRCEHGCVYCYARNTHIGDTVLVQISKPSS